MSLIKVETFTHNCGSVKYAPGTFKSTSFQAWVRAWSFQYLRREREYSIHRYVQWIHKLEIHIKTVTTKSFYKLKLFYVNLL